MSIKVFPETCRTKLLSGCRAHTKVTMELYDFYNPKPSFSPKNGELPAAYRNTVVCGDCCDVLRRIPDNCVDMIVTSPPYNFGREYDCRCDSLSLQQYLSGLKSALDECIRVLKWSGRLALNIQPLFYGQIPTHHILSNHLLSKGLIWKAEILWDKRNYNCHYCTWGSWRSPSSPYLKYTWEFVEVFCKGTLRKPGKQEDADITAGEFKSWTSAHWAIPPERRMKRFGHPAMFPEELVERLLKLFSYRGDTVLDPFNGAGTTTFVARKTGRTYLGIDLSERYCRTAKQRLAMP